MSQYQLPRVSGPAWRCDYCATHNARNVSRFGLARLIPCIVPCTVPCTVDRDFASTVVVLASSDSEVLDFMLHPPIQTLKTQDMSTIQLEIQMDV